MGKLYRYFLWMNVRAGLVLLPGVWAAFWVFSKAGWDARACGVITIIVSPLLVPILAAMRFGQNLSWIRGLPIKKREILLTNYLLNLTYFPLSLLWAALAGGVPLLVYFGEVSPDVRRILEDAARGFGDFSTGVVAWAHWILFFILGQTFAFAIFSRSQLRAAHRAPLTTHPRKLARYYVAGVSGGALVLFSFQRFDSRLLVGALLSIALVAAILRASLTEVGISARRRKAAIVTGVTLTASICLLVFIAAIRQIRAENPVRAGQAISFLGQLSPLGAERAIAQLLMTDLEADSLREFLARYRDLRGIVGKIPPNDPALPLEMVVGSKSHRDGLELIADYYDFTSLTFDQTRAFLGRYQNASGDGDARWILNYFLVPDLIARWRDFARSANPWEALLGVLASRYSDDSKDPDELKMILPRVPEEAFQDAVLSLSLKEGSRIPLREATQAGLQRSRTHMDCADFTPKSLEDLKDVSEGKLNSCIRRIALSKTPGVKQRLENMGWIRLPLGKNAHKVISDILKH